MHSAGCLVSSFHHCEHGGRRKRKSRTVTVEHVDGVHGHGAYTRRRVGMVCVAGSVGACACVCVRVDRICFCVGRCPLEPQLPWTRYRGASLPPGAAEPIVAWRTRPALSAASKIAPTADLLDNSRKINNNKDMSACLCTKVARLTTPPFQFVVRARLRSLRFCFVKTQPTGQHRLVGSGGG